MTLQDNVDALAKMIERNDAARILDAHARGVLTDRDLAQFRNTYARIANLLESIAELLNRDGNK